MWSENSAETIFQKRKVGKLKNGYEASFLVLGGNPIDDLGNIQKIEMRVKEGHILR
jgi:imidazolonepropionase-like amidohydrolase